MSEQKLFYIQENGQVTLPVKWRKKYGLKKGDMVVFQETDEGLLVSPKETLAMKLLDDLGAALKAKGVSLDELIAEGDKSDKPSTMRYIEKKRSRMLRVFVDTSVLFAAAYSASGFARDLIRLAIDNLSYG